LNTQDYVDVFIFSRQSRGLSPITIKWYREILNKFQYSHPDYPPVEPEAIEIFLAHCPGKDERRHGYYRVLKCFYRFLQRRYNYKNPMLSIDPPKIIKKDPSIFTPKELYYLLQYPHSSMIKAALTFLIDTGCRLGECHSLIPENLLETEWGYIAKVNGKTGSRYVPITYDTYLLIKDQIPFPYNVHWFGILISRAISDAGLTGTAHKLRHTFATLWDGNELVLKSIMGHSKLSTTELYRHLKTKNLCIQHNQYSPLVLIKGGYQDSLI
jgi:integrase/recombinase XerD